eukprot:PITA_14592
MDLKIAFLHGFLKEELFVEQPQGFEEHHRENKVCKLKKALYGLKQAPRACYARIDSYLIKLAFTRSNADPNLYFKTVQGLKYAAKNVKLHGYTNVDWASNVANRKKTYGCCFSLGSAMMSRKQKFVTLSTPEFEYIVVSVASCEVVWLRKLFGELFEQVPDTTVIYCDKKSEIRLAENHVFHDKSKHIEIKYHYIQDMVRRGAVRCHHISIDD